MFYHWKSNLSELQQVLQRVLLKIVLGGQAGFLEGELKQIIYTLVECNNTFNNSATKGFIIGCFEKHVVMNRLNEILIKGLKH